MLMYLDGEKPIAKGGGWTRNNPDDHGAYSDAAFLEELGDAIMMLLVAGVVQCRGDALQALEDKIKP